MSNSDWEEIGVYDIPDLIGDVQLLKKPEKPIVFLFDEEHGNMEVITHNINNAKVLIDTCNVQLIGLESHKGGKYWDEYAKEYVDNEPDYRFEPNSEYCEFYYGLENDYEGLLVGVECEGISNKLLTQFAYSNLPQEEYLSQNPLNVARSKHFIKTLFQHREERKVNGNMILNCGSNHNNHIADWIQSREIDKITQLEASYVRINIL